MPAEYSRRAVLGQIALGGALATAGPAGHAFAALDDRPWFFLTDNEARWLAAIVDVFIPADEYPSATQAGVVDYIDFQMATHYGKGARLYLQEPFSQGAPEQGYQAPCPPAELLRRGIAAALAEGDVTAQDAAGRERYVQAMSEAQGNIDDSDVPVGTFFTELLSLTNEGCFADPIYMGNNAYAGWEMVGFPGAHAYYLSFVDKHNRPFDKPPMGIAHGEYPHTFPRIVGGS
ncbi:gluconate 2-dehydrogenase subunit 3 family protein [Citreimonas salinaria]|uniref:Gluconate 2-dehydrogenase alpha chain/gluconate 2-dehydrogenase gamma chain n=1 Tax=Citreimonas salinaria TaxID=321339 RepID=A0A1H3J6L9_9RHOB|nr:gluconate 2-dehydrogenase subunit 3 family protein [Citreimonas salinaria]SDY34834.1 gluconate 2-dehydrogenase alpha chain/gluconate 2-dehydrogenase gamma chain [Citreimonas salinaria]